jgi:CheY-like chemotaxis protein
MTFSRPVHILLVEDKPNDTLRIIRALGTEFSRSLQAVEDGAEALAYLRQEGIYWNVPQPDIVLLDLDMVKRDSRQVLAGMRTDGRSRGIPVVFLLPEDTQRDCLRRYAGYATAFLPKFFSQEQFSKLLHGVVGPVTHNAKYPPQDPPDMRSQSRN